MEHVSRLVNLETLYLCYTRVTDSGVQKLKTLTRLRQLDLSRTMVTGSGLQELRNLTRLESLNSAMQRLRMPGWCNSAR